MKRIPLYLKLIAAIGWLSIFSCSKSARLAQDLPANQAATAKAQAIALAGTGAAPSEHMNFYFSQEATLMMQRIKITASAGAEYFSIINFTGGYMGLQERPSDKILIGSYWDPNTSAGIYSRVAYNDPTTQTSRFGGEGDGWKTMNGTNWLLNTWYTAVVKSWKVGDETQVAIFLKNEATGRWFHTATLARNGGPGYLGDHIDAFLENWTGDNAAYDGRFVRKAFFKDAWIMNTNNVWVKHNSRSFYANGNDAGRNKIYDRAFNAGYDASQDAYFMEHGGNVTPSAAFGTGRSISLPAQTNQGSAPALNVGLVKSMAVTYSSGTATVNWVMDSTRSPQFSSKVEILTPNGAVLATQEEILPQKRKATITTNLNNGLYVARITITDIFNQKATAVSKAFLVGSSAWYKIKNLKTGLYLDVDGASTSNSASIVQQTSGSGLTQQWSLANAGTGLVLVNRGSGKNIDLPASTQSSGTNPVQYQGTGALNQQWNLLFVANNTFLIQSNMSNHLVIDVPASTQVAGAKLIIYGQNGNEGSPNQRWILEAP